MDLSKYLDITKDYSLPEHDETVNPIDEFRSVLDKAGYPVPNDVIPDGSIHRWDDPTRNKKDKPYWYILELHNGNILAGRYGSWINGESHSFFSTGFYGLDQIDCFALDKSIRHKASIENEERKEYQKVVANDARIILSMCTKLDSHKYLTDKGVKSYGLAKNGDGDIIIPMVDHDNKLWNIQRIYKNGDKKFYPGAKVSGCRFIINGDTNTILLVEGYATAASCHEATGFTTIVAFNAGNMINIAKDLKGKKYIIIADNDESKTGENKAKECINTYGGKYILVPENGMDANDYAQKFGLSELKNLILEKSKYSAVDKLNALTVRNDYIESLGNEKWLFPNLIIDTSLMAIVAEGGGGKTTICYNYIAPHIIKEHGKVIYYIDCDSPRYDHKKMQEMAISNGRDKFRWVNPDTHGASEQDVLDLLDEMLSTKTSELNNFVFFFDTLKKFADLFSKKEVKKFYKRVRSLVTNGATVILLSHANKSRSAEGNLIPEGVGDVRNDVDTLLFFDVAETGYEGETVITTIVDRNKNGMVKVRGLYEPISFRIGSDRTVKLLKEVIALPTINGKEVKPGSKQENLIPDHDIKAWIYQALIDFGRLTNQKDIIAKATEYGFPKNRTIKLLSEGSIQENDAKEGDVFHRKGGYNNRETLYSIFGSPWVK